MGRDYHLDGRRQTEKTQRGTLFGTRATRIDHSQVKIGSRQLIGPAVLNATGAVTQTLTGLIDATTATFTNLTVAGNVSIGGTLSLNTPLPVSSGGTGTATPALVNGTGITITGTWPDQTIAYSGALSNQSDVVIASPTDTQVLTYESSSGKWKNKAGAAGSTTLAGLTDVSISSPTDAQVLTYDNATSKWENKAATGGGGTTPPTNIIYPGTTQPDGSILIAANTTANTTLPALAAGKVMRIKAILKMKSSGTTTVGIQFGVDATHGYLLQVSNNATMDLFKLVAGTYTGIGSGQWTNTTIDSTCEALLEIIVHCIGASKNFITCRVHAGGTGRQGWGVAACYDTTFDLTAQVVTFSNNEGELVYIVNADTSSSIYR